MPELSVILCTHNPNRERLSRTLEGLRRQSLDPSSWELILVDSASTLPLGPPDLANARVIREEEPGLTRARLAGFAASTGEIIVFVDDDNVLSSTYLEDAMALLRKHSQVGVAGGRITPEYETEPPAWIQECHVILALRDFGDQEHFAQWSSPNDPWPIIAPVGAGMVIRRRELARYATAAQADTRRMSLDRREQSLASGGDCDIVMTVLNSGASVCYAPKLSMVHLIPSTRLTRDYLGRLAEGAMHSWVQVLDIHGRRPWKPVSHWMVPILAVKYYLTSHAWKSAAHWIRWRTHVGQARGRAELSP